MIGRRRRARPERPSPVAGVMADAFKTKPFGSHGQMIVASSPTEPPPAPVQPFVIEPPPWHGQPPPARLPEPVPPVPGEMGREALAELKAQTEEYSPPAPKLGPPEKVQPLTRPTFPKPDWRGADKP